MPFTSLPATGATSWYPWGTDVHAIASHPLHEPVARYLPSNYVAGTTDIGQYVQAAVDAINGEGRGFIVLPPGTHLWDSTVYLNPLSHELSYCIQGHGRGTYIQLGAGLNTAYAIVLNQNSSGVRGLATNPGFPTLIFRDMEVEGQSAAGARSLIFSDTSNVTLENLRLRTLLYATRAINYCDLMTFRKIHWMPNGVTGGALYYNHGNGDGGLVEQITAADDAVVVDAANLNGLTINGPIVGRYILTGCDATEVIAAHLDGSTAGAGQANPWFLIQSSRVAFRGGWDHSPDGNVPPFQINDTDATRSSDVTWDGYMWGFQPDAPTKVRSPHVFVNAAQPSTRLRFRHCRGHLKQVGGTSRPQAGPSFVATDSTIQAAFDAYPTAMLEDVDLINDDLGWRFVSPSPISGRAFVRIATAPTLAATSSTLWTGNQATATYFYKIAVYTDKARALHTAASAESSVAITSGNIAQLSTVHGASPALVRVWRGTTTGTYDRYIDLTIGSAAARIYDLGATVDGYSWITTGVPTPPTTNTTMDGFVVGRDARFEGPAAPTAGAWLLSDRVYDSSPAAGGTEGWVCVTAGSPGTWKTFGSIGA